MYTSIIKTVTGVGQVEFSSTDFRFDSNDNAICEFAEWEEKHFDSSENKIIEEYYKANEVEIRSELAMKYDRNYDPTPR